MSDAPRLEWEVASYHGVNRWHMLGKSEASNPGAALESWIEEAGGIRAEWKTGGLRSGWYGVRSDDQPAWQPFRVDKTGVRRVQTHSPIR